MQLSMLADAQVPSEWNTIQARYILLVVTIQALEALHEFCPLNEIVVGYMQCSLSWLVAPHAVFLVLLRSHQLQLIAAPHAAAATFTASLGRRRISCSLRI